MTDLTTPSTRRLTSIDTLRGIVMILMALDHVRDFFGVPGVSPTNLAQTTVPLFLTRWITHICAPTFFLLTGTGAFLARSRKSIPELSRFLLIRGVWLILLELTVIRCLGFQFNFDYQVTLLVVIWALGWAMVVLAGLVWLPMPALLAFGVVMIAGHNLLDGVRSTHPLWVILHSPGFVVNRPGLRGLCRLPVDSRGSESPPSAMHSARSIAGAPSGAGGSSCAGGPASRWRSSCFARSMSMATQRHGPCRVPARSRSCHSST